MTAHTIHLSCPPSPQTAAMLIEVGVKRVEFDAPTAEYLREQGDTYRAALDALREANVEILI